MGASTDVTAFCTTVFTSEMLSGVTVAGGSDEFDAEEPLPPPPPQDKHSRTVAQTTRENPKR
jgi:hypothetical protein